MAAGFAAATAAFVTSRFGVAGTLLGAALTAMIITGGSAILRAYLETVTGNVRKAPRKLRERRNRWKAGRSVDPETLPERPDLRDNLAGRMRAALDWFSHLPPLVRRSILVKGLIAAAVAFIIGMGAVWAVEKGIGNSLSCGIWSECPEGATPGIHLGDDRDTGAGSSLTFGRTRTQVAPGYRQQAAPAYQQNGLQKSRSYDQQQAPGYRQQPASAGNNEPGRGILQPDRPVDEDVPARPEPPNSASPAPGDEASPPPQSESPSRASPAPSQ